MKIKTIVITAVLLPLVFAGCSTGVKNKTVETQNILVSATAADAAEPSVAVAADGTTLVVWVEHGADKAADVFLQKFDAKGKIVSKRVRINQEAGVATAWRGDPPTIAVAPNNTIYVGWTARTKSADDRHATDLMISVSTDGGSSFNPPVKVNDDTIPAVHGMHSLAVDKNGKVYVAWLDERFLKNNRAEQPIGSSPNSFQYEKAHDGKSTGETKPMQHSEANREVYFAWSEDGGKTFSPNRKLAANVCPCCKTAVLVAPDGRIYAAWRQVLDGDFRHIAVVASNNDGESFGSATIVSDDHWQIAGCPVSGASLAMGKNGALNVLWFTAGTSGTTGIYRAESVDEGKTFAPRQLESAGTALGTPVLLSDAGQQNLVRVWSADGKIYFANSVNNTLEVKELGNGELPSAALAGKRLAVAFVKNENDKRAVWLSFTEN